jgi:hypothetical protein
LSVALLFVGGAIMLAIVTRTARVSGVPAQEPA